MKSTPDTHDLPVDGAKRADVAGVGPSEEDSTADEGAEPSLEARLAPYAVARVASDEDAVGGRDPVDDRGHLLFVGTPQGYQLIERAGPPPAIPDELSVPQHEGTFHVTKLAASPLPNDPRVCAYLER